MVGIDREGLAAGLPQFVLPEGSTEAIGTGAQVSLDEQAARHIRVLRLEAGALVGIRDGRGGIGEGQIVRVTRTMAQVEITAAEARLPLPEVHMLVPVADRDRMLWLAEKCAELGATSWRPVLWRRSRSVSPRGKGVAFQGRIRSRMMLALAQSEGAWLPQRFPDATLERAIIAAPEGTRVVLDSESEPLVGRDLAGAQASFEPPVVLAIGPEGGLEANEMAALTEAGFKARSMGPTILRFETAAVAALAIARTVLDTRTGLNHTTPETVDGGN